MTTKTLVRAGVQLLLRGSNRQSANVETCIFLDKLLKCLKNHHQKINNKSKDEKELPSSSHSKYVTHRATYDQVRVDLPSKSEQRQIIESLCKAYDPTNEQS
ncbi:unnamed protein product [Rotaria magnacalcarata]|uniref:Uncharacterized protein n=1 Tax=Rotaria magnacalcarata TaxID=392030 RepID=A0A816DM42_9BILA|nr:unnamed protein product [Rotaria magnacalcarata]CAF1639199.1 unnamed protein product [Rotaria magnacalcarata]CAF1939106.1 unnamed protein product [Rotaria magnacalcarata]CAF3871087.1 unnamed protein product [Rotaria magnacalcarata]CAF4008949.1 unnamed protein product [Rotaria magnacalcarata]